VLYYKYMLKKWNEFWLRYPVSGLTLWNIIVFTIFTYLLVCFFFEDNLYILGLLALGPVVFVTLLLDMYRIFKKK
jgi:hypothetical protein